MRKTAEQIAHTVIAKLAAEMKDVFVTEGKMRVKAYPTKAQAQKSEEYQKSKETDRPFHFVVDKD